MRSFLASRRQSQPGIHPALQSFADECRGVIWRLLAYMGALALLVIIAISLFESIDLEPIAEPAARSISGASWSAAGRSPPAFAVSHFESAGKTEAHEVFRHPDGGRRDVLRWSMADRPVAELELYRPGLEAARAGPSADDVAGRMDPGGFREIAGEGIVDSKFGPVALFGFADRLGDSQRCLGFMKNLAAANLQVSRWSCQGDGLPARRAAIACTFNRLVLLAARNEPRLAELFAHAELKRGDCVSGAALSASSADWVSGAQNPSLRGSL
ncbi:MAG: hypothetical protein H7312_06995 [Tardiphaga sp.]|nr:hypothetical protein [Tardiphaga sp.]